MFSSSLAHRTLATASYPTLPYPALSHRYPIYPYPTSSVTDLFYVATSTEPHPSSLTDRELGLHGVFQRLVGQGSRCRGASRHSSTRRRGVGARRPSPRHSTLRVGASSAPANTRCGSRSEVGAVISPAVTRLILPERYSFAQVSSA